MEWKGCFCLIGVAIIKGFFIPFFLNMLCHVIICSVPVEQARHEVECNVHRPTEVLSLWLSYDDGGALNTW